MGVVGKFMMFVCAEGENEFSHGRRENFFPFVVSSMGMLGERRKLFTEPLNSPSPMAAQQSTVTIDSVTFKLVIECAGRGFRSQQRDIRYSSKQNSERMSAAAGSEPRMPRLCKRKFQIFSFIDFSDALPRDRSHRSAGMCCLCGEM